MTRVAMPCVTTALNHNTAIHQMVDGSLLQMAGQSWNGETDAQMEQKYSLVSENIIENLKLPNK